MPVVSMREEFVQLSKSIDLSKLNGGSVLITGASGLIGTYFLGTLLTARDRGEPIGSITVTTRSGVFPKTNLNLLDVDVRTGDLGDWVFANSLPEADLIIHAAGYGQPGKFMSDPFLTLRINTFATEVLLRKTRPGGRFLFVSSSEVYSGLESHEYTETQIGTTNTSHPRAPYIEAKRCGETYTSLASQHFGIRSTSARLALAYGPGVGMTDERVLNQFVKSALTSGRIEMKDTGIARRTYCYVTDAIRLMFAALFIGDESVYNIGGTSRTSIQELAVLIGEMTGAEVVVPEVGVGIVGAPQDVKLNIDKVLRLVDDNSFIDMRDGLLRTISWYQQLI